MLVLDPMPERDPRPPIAAGDKVFVNANAYALKTDPKKVVITPGGAAPPR